MVLLVGPNNAGKSQALKDLMGLARDLQYVGRSLVSVDYQKRADVDLQDWAIGNLPQIEREGVSRFQVEGWGEVTAQEIIGQWSQPNLSVLTQLFIFHADGTSRLSAGDSQQSLDFTTQVPYAPRPKGVPGIQH